MDVQLTKDKQVIVHHDPTIERLTGVNTLITDLDYNDIPLCLIESKMHFGFGSYHQKEGIDDGRIPLLSNVFRDNPRTPMNIDLKGGDNELMFKVYQLIVEYNREEITYFGDMNEKRNRQAQEMGKDAGIRTYASIKYTVWTVVCYFLGVLQF
jgi:glycerophosphoryl diester phosphodiesterase